MTELVKVEMSYEELKQISLGMANKIRRILESSVNLRPHLIAVSRGGITAAHIIATELKLPLNYFDPSRFSLAWPLAGDPQTVWIFIEDLVAKGRTLDIVRDFAARTNQVNALFCPVLIDQGYATENRLEDFPIHGIVSKDWIVFPYERTERVRPGDWGLFRNGTSESSKKD